MNVRSRAMIRYRDSDSIRECRNSRDAKGKGDALAKAAILKQESGRDGSPVGTISNKGERVRTGRAAGDEDAISLLDGTCRSHAAGGLQGGSQARAGAC